MAAVFALGAVVLAILVPLPWWLTILGGAPVSVYWVNRLQLRRSTCVVRAAQGVIEDDQFGTTPADAGAAAASRRVARGIIVEAIAVGVLAAILIQVVINFLRPN